MPDRDAALEHAVAELALGALPPFADAEALAAWLVAAGVHAEDRPSFLAQAQRWGVYRGLVQGTLRGVLELALPRTVARMGPAFEGAFQGFLSGAGPRSHALRDTITEFLACMAPRWAAEPGLGAWLGELAAVEALRITLGSAPDTAVPAPAELALDRPVALLEATALLALDHAVHLLPDDVEDRSLPAPRRTHLLAYRDAEHELRFLELTPVAAAILARLHRGEALGAAITAGAAEAGATPTAALLEGTARLLADLAERGVLLGPRAEAPLPGPASRTSAPPPGTNPAISAPPSAVTPGAAAPGAGIWPPGTGLGYRSSLPAPAVSPHRNDPHE